MPFQRLGRRLYESLVRFIFLALVVGIVWLILQFYSVAELEAYARQFWEWWSGLVEGDYAQYWNPFGAALTLFLIAAFVLAPFMPRRRSSHTHHDSSDERESDGGNGGD